MDQKDNEIPKLVIDFWSHRNPSILMDECEFLNDKYEDSDKWGEVAIFKCSAKEISDALYVVLFASDGNLTARELDEDELNFLLHGILPDYNDKNN